MSALATPRRPAKRIGGAPFSPPRRFACTEPALLSVEPKRNAAASCSPRRPAVPRRKTPAVVATGALTARGDQDGRARPDRSADTSSVASTAYGVRAERYVSRLLGKKAGQACEEGALEWPLITELDVADHHSQQRERREQVLRQRLENRAHLEAQQASQLQAKEECRKLWRQWRDDLEADAERFRKEQEVKRTEALELRRRFDEDRRRQLEQVQRRQRAQREADEQEGREMVRAAQEAARREEERDAQRRERERAIALKMAEEAKMARERKERQQQEEFRNDVRMAHEQLELLDKQERERAHAIELRRQQQMRLMERYEVGVRGELERQALEDEERAQRQQRAFAEKEQAQLAAKERRKQAMHAAQRAAVQRQLEEQEQERQRQREEDRQFADAQRRDAEDADRRAQAAQLRRHEANLANAEFVKGQIRNKTGVMPFNLQRDQMNEEERGMNRDKLDRAQDPTRPDGMQLLLEHKRKEYAHASDSQIP